LTKGNSFTIGLSLDEKIRRLQGPILVLGGSGFIGANVALELLRHRTDVYATTTRLPAWRLEPLPARNVKLVDLLIDSNLDELIETVKPQTIIDCVAYGAYSFETDSQIIYQTNFNLVSRLVARLEPRKIAIYLHSGSSSEYGNNASGPQENSVLEPNSHYAVSKAATAGLLYYYGRQKGFPCVNLRLYSIYGPMEDSSRLIPNLVRFGVAGRYPELVDPNISRDFLYVQDAVEAYIDVALNLTTDDYGASFNIGTGRKTTIGECAACARNVFSIQEEPRFSMPGREWDMTEWYANIHEVQQKIGWQPRTTFEEGLARTADWFRGLKDKEKYFQSSKRFGLDTKYSVSAIIACYKDGQAFPVMYERLRNTFNHLNIDYEIIFVNDGSPDDSEEVIRAISRNDRRVTGISHSRNFGSQSAFRSGMEISTKNSCVLLDGDLQDPPELIETMVAKWRDGYDVVYGRRVKREASFFMQFAYKAFYRVFDYFSYVRIPHDAGDFSLMDRQVVAAILRFPERDLFLRGVRAYAGFRQVGIDYVRPERMFGVTTNSFFRNIGWAKKGIFSFSYVPLNILSTSGVLLFGITVVLMGVQMVTRLLLPNLAPRGITTLLLSVLFFGSLNLLALSIVGEYLAKIFEEVKRRPHFIRRSVVREGEVRLATLDAKRGEES
jgi:nucleoside-diphosphate-sugar epimerase/glycosyltransferase involved in cell wall biosynthesis